MHSVINYKELRFQYHLILRKGVRVDLKMNLHITLKSH